MPQQLARLIVPLDTSTLAESVIPWAALVARDRGMEVLLVSVWDRAEPLPGLVDHLSEPEGMNRLRDYLDGVAASPLLRGITVASSVCSGDPVEEIARIASDAPGSIVMLGSHGLGGYRESVMGSVSERLLRTLRVPVFFIPAESSP